MLFYSATLRTNEPTDSCIMPHSYVNPPFSVILDELEFAVGYYQTSLSIFYPLGPPLKAHTLGLVTVPRNCVPSWGFSFFGSSRSAAFRRSCICSATFTSEESLYLRFLLCADGGKLWISRITPKLKFYFVSKTCSLVTSVNI